MSNRSNDAKHVAPGKRAVSPNKHDPRNLDSAVIAADIAAFRKRGGRIEVLGNTPLRTDSNINAFRSSGKASKT